MFFLLLLVSKPRLAIYASLCIALPLAAWECSISTNTRLLASTPLTSATEQSLISGFELPRKIVMPTITRGDESQRPQKRRSVSSSLLTDDDRQKAFDLAVKRAQARSRSQSAPLADNLKSLFPEFTLKNATTAPDSSERRLVNLIRIPKAGSSALSATARALVGCGPDGYACCDPLKSAEEATPACPLVDLSCPPVRGCTGHYPDYTYTGASTIYDNKDNNIDAAEPTITSLRHPTSRAVSAFFYSQPHRPPGGCKTWACFDADFVQHPRWRNPVTKMLSGYFPYRNMNRQHDNNIGPISVNVAKRRLCDFVWFGISEMPIPSALLLYEVQPFAQLLPNPVAFGLPARDFALRPRNMRKGNPKRKNGNDEYLEFKNGVYQEMNGTALVEQYHAHDMEVYRFGVALFCERISESGLMDVAADAGLLQHFQACADAKRSSLSEPKLCAALVAESI